MNIKFPVYQPSLIGNEKKYVNECLDSNWISSKGQFVNKFETEFANFLEVKYGAAVSNGTVALHLALLALGIGEGDEVIVPTLTYIASVNAITYTNAIPVFADSLESNWQLDPKEVEKKITKKTKAVLAVHLYGHPCDMKSLQKICSDKKIYLIEDCAEALGSLYEGKQVGSYGDISTFSFYGNKTITTGEGGMVVTNNEALDRKVRSLKGQGLATNREYWHDTIGYNYRMTNICAAIGLAQLEGIENTLAKKQQIAQWYSIALKDTQFELQPQDKNVKHSYWMCTIKTPENIGLMELKNHLRFNGIETRPVFFPIHTMPMYERPNEKFPIAEKISQNGITLPSYPDLTKDNIHEIVDKVRSFLK